VLLSPTRRGFNLLVWTLPFAAIILGAGGVYLVVRRWTRQQADEPAVDRAYMERVQQELKERSGG
jgi:cytochrome c-type biogenesis protein CcmH/NrfF